MLCPQDLPQSRVVSVMDRGIEQRPWLGAGQQRGHGRDHQVAIILVFGRCVGEAAFRGGDIDAAQRQDEFLEGDTRESAFLLAARYAGVLSIGIAFGQFTQFVAMVSTASATISRSLAGTAVPSTRLKSLISLSTAPAPCAHRAARRRYRGEIGDQIAPIRR